MARDESSSSSRNHHDSSSSSSSSSTVPAALAATTSSTAAALHIPSPTPSSTNTSQLPSPGLLPQQQIPSALAVDAALTVPSDPSLSPTTPAGFVLSHPRQENGDAATASPSPSSPAMSHAPPPPGGAGPGGPPRQQPPHLGYPGPAAYSTVPSTMPGAPYAYAPAAATTQPDVYRASSLSVSNPVPLPSIRAMDQMQPGPPVGPPMAPGQPMGIPMGVPVLTGNYYMTPGNPYGMSGDPTVHRFMLPPTDPRVMPHRPPKKEIKRRTKTGCLTCRRRRIKCDETHPTCNNCRKSKRECLGYDPIFKQQPGPSVIQPAPSSGQPTTTPTVPSSTPSVAPPPVSAPPPVPSNPYGSQPVMVAGSYVTSGPSASLAYDPSLASATPTVRSTHEAEYAGAIDPALQSLPSASSTASHDSGSHSVPAPDSLLRGGVPASVLTPSSSTVQSFAELKSRLAHAGRPAKKMKIDEIIDSLGQAPVQQEIAQTPATLSEITRVYHEIYAKGLAALFESNWYCFKDDRGLDAFPENQQLRDQFAIFLSILEAIRNPAETARLQYSGILETRIVWYLSCLAFTTPDKSNASMTTLPADGDAAETRNRLRVMVALLEGDYLDTNPLVYPFTDPNPTRLRQFEFWHTLGEFVRLRDFASREQVLLRLRTLLEGRENRDLLYSIAVTRQLSPSYPSGYENSIPQYLNEDADPKHKLAVASKFIRDEARVGGGTTNVIRRFSDIAIRAFINPGFNIGVRGS